MIRLLIKGNKEEAIQAAAAKHIPFTFVKEIHPPTFLGRVETMGDTSKDNLDQVQAWLNEDMQPVDKDSPYPIGSLLWYKFL